MPTRKLEQLRTFVRVAELGSFGAAARELGLSPSAVSKQVRLLEARLEARLLNRTTRRVALTDIGRLYLERSRDILRELDDLDAEVRTLHASLRGTLRVSAPQDFGRLFLCGIVARFAVQHPDLRIEFDLTDRIVDVIQEGFDVVLRLTRPEDSSLVARRIGECERVLVASPDYLAQYGTPERPRDLDHHNCIEYEYAGGTGGWRFRADGRVRVIQPTGRLRANAGWAMQEMALAGLGIALLPAFLVRDDIREGRLVTLLDDALDADLVLMAVMPQRAQVSAKSRAFIDFAAESLWRQSGWRRALSTAQPTEE